MRDVALYDTDGCMSPVWVVTPEALDAGALDALAAAMQTAEQRWPRSLYIEEATALVSLTGLEALAHVGVAVYVTGSGIVDVDGLSGLTTLDGYVDFEFNPALESLAGLSGLTEVPSDLLLYGNGALTSLTGIDNVTRAGSMLWVVDNDAMTSLDGLSALTEVADDLHVSDNAALCDDEVDALLAQLPSFSADIYRDGNTGACP